MPTLVAIGRRLMPLFASPRSVGATPAQVALSWIADRPGVIAPIVGARTVEHLGNNLGAAGLTLDNAATAALEKVGALAWWSPTLP